MHIPTRMQTGLLPRLITVLGIFALCAGATSRSCTIADSDGDGGGDDEPDFVTELELQNASGEVTDTFERGALIQMVLTVRNRTNRTITLNFTTGRQSDFVVVREGTDDVVWQRSVGDTITTTTPSTLEFAPRQVMTVTTEFRQLDSNGQQVRTGAYEARGVLVFSGFDAQPLRADQLGSALERFTIN